MPNSLLYVPYARLHVMIDEPHPRCLLFKIKTQEREQEQKYLFSKPVSFNMGNRLYQHVDGVLIADKHFNQQRQIKSIVSLMQARPRENILVIPSLSYGDNLDLQISQIREQQKVQPFVGEVRNSQPEMFFRKRVDFALMSTPEVVAYKVLHPDVTYLDYPIEGVSLPITVHAMCNKTPETKAWLMQVDNALTKIYQDPSYSKIYERVYQDEELEMINGLLHKYRM